MSFNNNSCLFSWDTNSTIKATFNFIKQNQINQDGSENLTNIFLGLASLKSLSLENYTNLDIVFNLIEGKILEVLNNSVIILVLGECGNSEYTIAYSDIQNIQNTILATKREEYVEYINCILPCLCECEGNKNYDLLVDLRYKLAISEATTNILFYFIYGGIFSRGYNPTDLKVVKNVVLFQNGIVPITSISGYFTTKNSLE